MYVNQSGQHHVALQLHFQFTLCSKNIHALADGVVVRLSGPFSFGPLGPPVALSLAGSLQAWPSPCLGCCQQGIKDDLCAILGFCFGRKHVAILSFLKMPKSSDEMRKHLTSNLKAAKILISFGNFYEASNAYTENIRTIFAQCSLHVAYMLRSAPNSVDNQRAQCVQLNLSLCY